MGSHGFFRPLAAAFAVALLAAASKPYAHTVSGIVGGGGPLYYALLASYELAVAALGLSLARRLGAGGGDAFLGVFAASALALGYVAAAGILYGYARAPVAGDPLGLVLLVALYAAKGLQAGAIAALAASAAPGWLEAASVSGLYTIIALSGYDAASAALDGGARSLVFLLVARGFPAYALGAAAGYVAWAGGGRASYAFSAAAYPFLGLAPLAPSGGLLAASATVTVAAGLALASTHIYSSLRGGGGSWAVAALAVALAASALAAAAAAEGLMFWRPIVIVSGSMEPALSPGDLVILERVDPSEVRVGDIIAYTREGVTIVHRVVEAGEGYLVTKGDANDTPDPEPVMPEQVIGRVAVVVPGAGKPLILLSILASKSPVLAALALASPAMAALAASALLTLARGRGGGGRKR